MALMLEWFERVGYSADIAGLEREFGRALTKLRDWAAATRGQMPLKRLKENSHEAPALLFSRELTFGLKPIFQFMARLMT